MQTDTATLRCKRKHVQFGGETVPDGGLEPQEQASPCLVVAFPHVGCPWGRCPLSQAARRRFWGWAQVPALRICSSCGHCLVGSGKVPREGSGLVVDQRVGTGEACHGEGPLSPLSTESLLALPWARAGTCSPQESAQRPASCSPREGQGKEVHLTAASLLAQRGARHLVQTSLPAGPTAGTSSDCRRSLKRP